MSFLILKLMYIIFICKKYYINSKYIITFTFTTFN